MRTLPPPKPVPVAPRLLILGGLLAIGGLALLGLPGAAWLELASPVAALLTDRRAPADTAWPMAILQTLLWPWLLLPAYALAKRGLSPGRTRVLVTTAWTAMAAMLMALVMQVAEGRV